MCVQSKHGCISLWLLSSDTIKYVDLRNPHEYLVEHKVQMDAKKGLIVSNTEIINPRRMCEGYGSCSVCVCVSVCICPLPR